MNIGVEFPGQPVVASPLYDFERVMQTAVALQDILDVLETQFDDTSSFVDLDTGQVHTVSHDLLHKAEERENQQEDAGILKWQEDEWRIAQRIVTMSRFVKLPTVFDVHAWSIMQDFARSLESGEIGDDLLAAIHRAGAFRNFARTPSGGMALSRIGSHSGRRRCGRSPSTGAKSIT